MKVGGLKVLLLPHAARHSVLAPVIERGRREHGWRIGVFSLAEDAGASAALMDSPADYYAVPDLKSAAPWEADAQTAGRIRDLVRDCERRAKLPIHRIVLAGERLMGRGLGREFYHWPSSALTKMVLADNELPARLVERLFAVVADVLDRAKPDVVLGGQFGSPYAMVVHLVCRHRNIPCLSLRPSKILSDHSFWTDDFSMLNTDAIELCRRKVEEGAQSSARAQAFLTEFRARPRVVAYIHRNWASSATFLRWHFELALQAAIKLRFYLRRSKASEPKPIGSRMTAYYRRSYLSWSQRGMFDRFDESALSAKPYIYVAFHKEPELAINVQHPEWHSQKNLVALLSANLPVGYRLLVREHRYNIGRRPTRFYRDLLGYPGVKLVDPLDSQFKYIDNAALIVTDNGTTGWEGLIFGRNVLLLGENYYSATGIAPMVDAPVKLGAAILECCAGTRPHMADERERRLSALVDAEYETTLPDGDVDGLITALRLRLPAAS